MQVIQDPINKYFRVYDEKLKQYVGPDGKPISPGKIPNDQRKDYMLKKTHFNYE